MCLFRRTGLTAVVTLLVILLSPSGVLADSIDDDGDGYCDAVSCSDDSLPGDCDDGDETINPAAPETWYDGVDQDCDGQNDFDQDGDGYECDGAVDAACLGHAGADCDDSDADEFPGQTWYPDCDGDTYAIAIFETACSLEEANQSLICADDQAPDGGWQNSSGLDCDDENARIFPGAAEVTCDGLDNDCVAATSDNPDADADGFSVCVDCDDGDASVNPGAVEVTCDALDNDCNAVTLDNPDLDADGFGVCVDCDDADPSVNPAAPETWYDGVDQDCGGQNDYDQDGDGYECDGTVDVACQGHAGGDCADLNAAINPGAVEVTCDALDNDCNAVTLDNPDSDGDGFFVCVDDCDDADPDVNLCVSDDPPVMTIEMGYIQLDTYGEAPPTEHCFDITHQGRMVIDGVNGLIYICTELGWIAK